MSNQMILEFAHRRIHELNEEIRDMQLIIEEFSATDDNVVNVVDMNGIGWKNGKMECPFVIPTFNM
jgi:hypothetical protein